jgi:seryl-tRNA synthetase
MKTPGSATSTLPDGPLAMLAKALFLPLGAQGVVARTARFEEIIERLTILISHHRDARAEVLRFPPLMSRRQLERSGYLRSFPNLLGCVCALEGDEAAIRTAADRHEAGGDWTTSLAASELVLTPAACYPLYPLAADRGRVPDGGWIFDVAADCFRREPSADADRLQSFRMREFVRIAAPAEVEAFRDAWMARAVELAGALALPCTLEPANDPFFGVVGQIMAVSQLQQSLKFELRIPFGSAVTPTACMSFNYHRDYFAQVWGLRDARDEPVHTACVAFGMDRLAVALFATHGIDVRQWPQTTRRALEL